MKKTTNNQDKRNFYLAVLILIIGFIIDAYL
jgi:hypothetical protein